jgi:hypothetical protein
MVLTTRRGYRGTFTHFGTGWNWASANYAQSGTRLRLGSGLIPLIFIIFVNAAPAGDRLPMTGGAPFDFTTMMMDASRRRAAVDARMCDWSSKVHEVPGQRIVGLAGDEKGIRVATDSAPHLSVTPWACNHRRTPLKSMVFIDRNGCTRL